MTHSQLLLLAATLTVLPAVGTAQTEAGKAQLLPDQINEVRISESTRLIVRSGTESRLEVDGAQKNPIGKTSGSLLTVDAGVDKVVLVLAPNRSITLHAIDFSRLQIEGNFAPIEKLTLHTEDYANVRIDGADGDTLRARELRMKCEDFSHIDGRIPVQYYVGNFSAVDYSRIALTAADCNDRLSNGGNAKGRVSTVDDYAGIFLGRITQDGELQEELYYKRDSESELRGLHTVGDAISEIGHRKAKHRNRHPWENEFSLAFGWHNWGSEIGSGFGGATGDADVNTSLNHWYVDFSYPLINVSHFALTVGLGLEWDKYKFTTPEVCLEQGVPAAYSTYSFVGGNEWYSDRTRLKTRYVVIPISLRFGNPDGWNVSLTALPGLHWSGSHTGLRYQSKDAETTVNVKDYSIHRHLTPYKLDVRFDMRYKHFGAYIQIATMSILKNDCEELFPVKFGIIL